MIDQEWNIRDYTIIAKPYNQLTNKLQEYNITIINEKTKDEIKFDTESIGLLNEILQIIIYIYDFKDYDKYFQDYIDNGTVTKENYNKMIDRSKKLAIFLQKDWIDSIKKYLNSI